MLRLVISLPLSLLMALVLFYLLALTTSMGSKLADNQQVTPDFNFFMVRQESDVELRNRQLPPEPEEVVQQPPAMPKMQIQPAPSLTDSQLDITVPDIEMEMNLDLAPSLNNLAAPTPVMTFDSNPTVMSQVPPRYPQRALRRKQEGHVVVEFIVTTAGTVKPGSITIIESTPQGVFDKAVLRSIQRWRFKSRVVDGQAQAYKARQKLEFKLEK